MPAYGDPADDAAAAVMANAFPGREIVQNALPPADLAERQPALPDRYGCRGADVMQRGDRPIALQCPMKTKTLPVALVQERNHGDAGRTSPSSKPAWPKPRSPVPGWCCCRNCTTARTSASTSVDEFDHARPSRPEHRTPRQAGEAARRGAGEARCSKSRDRPVPQHRGGVRRRQRPPASTARCTSRTARVLREVLLHPGRPQYFTRSTPASAASACWCAGTSGIRKARG